MGRVTPEHPRYDPSADAGLFIEMMAMWPLQMPDAIWDAPEPRDLAAGSLARVVRRGCPVCDLGAKLATLSANLDLKSTGPVESLPALGFRRARIGFNVPHGATLDLIESTRWNNEPGRYLHSRRPGLYTINLSVIGLDANADQLQADGDAFSSMPAEASGTERQVIDSSEPGGMLIELVEHA